jgi:hypothetical protein
MVLVRQETISAGRAYRKTTCDGCPMAGEMRCLAMDGRHYGTVIVPWLAVGCGTFGRDPAIFVVNSESVALPVQWH